MHHHEYIYAIDWRSQFTLAGGGDRWDITILYFSQRRGSDSRLFQLLRQKSKKRIEKGPREEYSEFFFFPLLSSSASCFLFFDNFHLKRVSRVQGQHKSTKTEKRKRRQREKKKKHSIMHKLKKKESDVELHTNANAPLHAICRCFDK